MIWLANLEDRDSSQPEGNKGAANARRCSCYLEKHEVELTRSEDLLERDAVGILLHALLLGKGEELPGHQTQQVKLLHVGLEVDADAVSVENRTRLTKRSNRQSSLTCSGDKNSWISVPVRQTSSLLQQDAGTLLMCVPLWKVHLHSEALSQEVQHLGPCDAALLRDQAQHFGDTFLVEGIVFSALDQLLVDLEVCEVHQSLDASTRKPV